MPGATFWLVLSKSMRYPYLSARLAAKKPAMKAGEVPLELSVSVPDSLFSRPTLRAEVAIPEVAVPRITPEIQDGIAAVLSEQLGLRVHVTTEDPACSSET